MSTIYSQSPGTYVYVVSIPDVYQLWKLFKGNFWARFIWSSADICQSLLDNPTSTQKVDEDRRLAVRARNQAYNAIMVKVCESAPIRDRCRHDQGAVFSTPLVTSDVSGDYFHPSASGQARLAEESWKFRYTFGTPQNQAPTASFTSACSDLTCSFNASASTDDVGITDYAWNFGDGTTGSGVTTSRTYAAGGNYTVTLTVTDGGGLTGTTSAGVNPQTPPAVASMYVSDLVGVGTPVNRNFWRANVTATVLDTDGDPVANATVSGAFGSSGKSCVTAADGTCLLVSDNLRTNVGSVTFTLGNVSHTTVPYDRNLNVDNSVDVQRP
jgi:PKD repeat protein